MDFIEKVRIIEDLNRWAWKNNNYELSYLDVLILENVLDEIEKGYPTLNEAVERVEKNIGVRISNDPFLMGLIKKMIEIKNVY